MAEKADALLGHIGGRLDPPGAAPAPDYRPTFCDRLQQAVDTAARIGIMVDCLIENIGVPEPEPAPGAHR